MLPVPRRGRALARLAAAGLAGGLILSLLLPASPASANEWTVRVGPDVSTVVESMIAELVLGLRAEIRPCPEVGPDDNIPVLVGDIFQCRLREAGYAPADADRIAAEAVVVAHCESLFDPAIVVFDGAYLDRPHPATGFRYSAAGVFQFIRRTAELWIPGGYANVTNARLNIDAAARLYLHNRARGYGGWDDWACAAANDGFKVGSVLPGWPGGPAELPPWAMEHVRA